MTDAEVWLPYWNGNDKTSVANTLPRWYRCRLQKRDLKFVLPTSYFVLGYPLPLPPQKNDFMANTSDISRGMIIKQDGSLYKVIEFGENKTARAAAKVWAKLKGVDNNRSIEVTWNSGETIYPVRVERHDYQFLYKDDTGYNFMNTETFEQIAVQEAVIDAPQFLKEGDAVSALINTETEQPMSIELPDKIVVKVTYSEPGVRGDTATRTLKPATVETGATVMVPLFVNEGEMIRINTKTGDYVERVKE